MAISDARDSKLGSAESWFQMEFYILDQNFKKACFASSSHWLDFLHGQFPVCLGIPLQNLLLSLKKQALHIIFQLEGLLTASLTSYGDKIFFIQMFFLGKYCVRVAFQV